MCCSFCHSDDSFTHEGKNKLFEVFVSRLQHLFLSHFGVEYRFIFGPLLEQSPFSLYREQLKIPSIALTHTSLKRLGHPCGHKTFGFPTEEGMNSTIFQLFSILGLNTYDIAMFRGGKAANRIVHTIGRLVAFSGLPTAMFTIFEHTPSVRKHSI